MLFLTYIQGKAVSEWVRSMSDWLTTQVVDMGVQTWDRWLWDSCLLSFNRQFADTLQKEKARMTLCQGIRMQGQDLNGYIAHFEELVQHAEYDINGPQTIDMFTRGLLTSLYETIYQHDQPETFEQWRRAVLRRQGHWYHLNARKNLDKFKTSSQPRTTGPRPFFAPARHPDAMDMDCTRACLATAEDHEPGGYRTQWTQPQGQNSQGRGGPPMRLQGGFLQRGARPNWDNFQCYCCQQKGHISRYCPQNPRNNQPRPQQGRRAQTNDYYAQDEPIQAARTITENRTPQERAHEILGYMANQEEEVKDELIKELRNGGDFLHA